MGNKLMRRLFAVVIAIAMIMTSGIMVFAANEPSPGQGGKDPAVAYLNSTSASYDSKTITTKHSGKNCEKFKVYLRRPGKSWSLQRTTTAKSYTIKGLTRGALYEIAVSGVNSEGKAGNKSGVSYRWLQKTSHKVSSPAKGQLKVTWDKVSGATGYKIRYSKNSNMSGSTYVTVKASATSKTISGLKSGSTYYVQVYPIQTKNGHMHWGVIYSKRSAKVK